MTRTCAAPQMVSVLLLFLIGAGAKAQPTQRPTHHIAFAIDNSFSMKSSDPTGLRGVAAGLFVDSAALDSKVEAGLILFNDRVETEGRLFSIDELRLRLKPGPGGIPEPSGTTNMAAALERALGLLQGSSATQRSVVLITDGNPSNQQGRDKAQETKILQELVPHAKSTGVRIFALGREGEVDQAFLDNITRPTGGQTLLFKNSYQLLNRAKELMGRQDDIHLLANEALTGRQNDLEFELPPGTDRARVTIILENVLLSDSSGFGPSQILFSLDGPDPGNGGWTYLVSKNEIPVAGAWTTFLSKAGKYRLKVSLNKPGVDVHDGLRVFVEALSVLDLEATLSPVGQTEFFFDDTLQVDAVLKGGDGSTLDPSTYTLNGTIELPSGATVAIPFSGGSGSFAVPAVGGTHLVVIEAVTQALGRRKKTLSYRARKDDVTLEAKPASLTFPGPLGPEDLDIEARFTLYPTFPDGARPRPTRLTITARSDVGAVQLRTAAGAALRVDGRPGNSLDPPGLEMIVTVALDESHPLTTLRAGSYRGEIFIQAPDAGEEISIPFQFDLRIPRFELIDTAERITLWWDPSRGRRVFLGRVETDTARDSTFSITLDDAVQASNGLGPMVKLQVAKDGGKVLEPIALLTGGQAGLSTYGPFKLPARGAVDLDLIVAPLDPNLWTSLEQREHPFSLRLVSDLGMEVNYQPHIATLGGPWWRLPWLGPLSPHGIHWLRWLILGNGGALGCFLFLRRFGRWRRFFRFRTGSLHPLPQGELRIGDPATAGSEGLTLPASHAELQDALVANVRPDPGRNNELALEDRSEGRWLRQNARPVVGISSLREGDTLSIEEEDGDPLWELDYQGFDPEHRAGEVEVMERPITLPFWKIGRKVLSTFLTLAILVWILAWDAVASFAYGIPGLETLLIKFFGNGG